MGPFFSLISAPFSTSASDEMLETQTREVLRRASLNSRPNASAGRQAKATSGSHRLAALTCTEPHRLYSTDEDFTEEHISATLCLGDDGPDGPQMPLKLMLRQSL